MKKVLSILLCILLLCSCSANKNTNEKVGSDSGVWISYYELNSMLDSEKGFKTEFSTVLENCKKLKIQNLYIHTRAFGESLYESQYFPLLKSAKAYDYDIFEFILSECKKAGLKVHAWINPYRISSSSEDITKINSLSPAFKWLNDTDQQNDSNVCFSGGIYYNPASSDVLKLILDSIRELITKYDVDGVHFDDYFYPTTDMEFDSISYNEYKKTAQNPLSLENWRRENVNLLISSCHTVIEYMNKDIVFSVSPAADIKKNLNNLYADADCWIKNGYIDEIIPQLYFGFEYPDSKFSFLNLLEEWKELTRQNTNVKLKIGLAFYKAEPTFDADISEWKNNDDIIARQVAVCESDNAVGGYVYFSYSSVFSQSGAFKRQREKLLEYLN